MITDCSKSIALSVLVLASAISAPSYPTVMQVFPPCRVREQQHGKATVVMSPQEARRVEKAADRFVRRFRETLNFGIVFDEMFVEDAIQRLRNARYFENIYLSQNLIEKVDNSALKRTYKAYINYYYLKAAYDLSIRPLVGNEQKGEPPLPSDINCALKASKYLSVLLDDGMGDGTTVTTPQELDLFIADLEVVATSYRKHLPQNVFESRTYKANLKTLNTEARRVLRIRDGYEDFDVRKGTNVYMVEQDFFVIYLVEENAELKVLTLGMGN